MNKIESILENLLDELKKLDLDNLIDTTNQIKVKLHEVSPFKFEPVDCVLWIKNETLKANSYNPNSVAPPEMKLLEQSILQDGYTQPIVTWFTDDFEYEVVDGFHRNRVGKESKEIRDRVKGYLPITLINVERTNLSDRMASTIRHNRARGKHSVNSMSDIVVELKKRNRSDEWIAKNLGMDTDEVLRLTQISGLQEMFTDVDFSDSWDIGIFEDNDANI